MSEIPCENCITLPICKQVRSRDSFTRTTLKILCAKCYIIDDYTDGPLSINLSRKWNEKTTSEVIEFFRSIRNE